MWFVLYVNHHNRLLEMVSSISLSITESDVILGTKLIAKLRVSLHLILYSLPPRLSPYLFYPYAYFLHFSTKAPGCTWPPLLEWKSKMKKVKKEWNSHQC
jgi:hypothetical protein